MVIITGPTACGKTLRAVDLANAVGGEIVSADSRQVYRGMDIGSGKDLEEYGTVPYHMIDVAEAGEMFNLFRWLKGARQAITDIESRGREAIVCGGSGMYVEALAAGTSLPEVPPDPLLRESLRDKSLYELREILSRMKVLHNSTDTDCIPRAIRAIEIQTYYHNHPEFAPMGRLSSPRLPNPLIIGLDIDRETRRKRITQRLDARLKEGMIEEVARLLKKGVSPDVLINYGLEYRFITLYLRGSLTHEEMTRQLEIAIHQFAKRQMTWFRGMARRGFTIEWLPWDMNRVEFVATVIHLMTQHQQQ
ncbi:MAG: tRNA (adenosine(37)-N6)-dimethylallyltransferase MiaA [Pseudoflavonifractor sp.]|nr:tRNA (adenosine(37)-N6)-dimethylallyltransferase MiaA [Alloprevotella sp.]MCM1116906.1 tRNA (adenosine(37)-N6)-dimethylallyltransferase MiaA [Pseudoflavonifractor sp.]